jgi:sugar O-acyltransferase (sialic acid O-acetyltransferase NeuD family)
VGSSDTQVLILGAGGFARELLGYFRRYAGPDAVAGFASDNPMQHGRELLGVPVLGAMDGLDLTAYLLICGVGSPALKHRFVARAASATFAQLLPTEPLPFSIFVGDDTTFGPGTLLCPGVSVTTNVAVGAHVTINLGCTIGHDVRIGDFCTLSPGVHLSGACHIGEMTELGTGVVVLPGVVIGRGCVIGAGAVVTRSLPDGVTAVGVPAKVVRRSPLLDSAADPSTPNPAKPAAPSAP